MQITGAEIFDINDGFIRRTLYLDGERLTDAAGGEALDFSGCRIIPGLTDLHFHGCVGADFSDGDIDGLQKMADFELERGIMQICPAGMTLLPEQLEKICRLAQQHRSSSTSGAELVGINLEGPFLSAEKKGAQNGDWLQAPSYELFMRLYDMSGGLVKLLTLAPELDGAMDFIEKASKTVRISLGHTTADYDTATAAFKAGARQVTHLYNAMLPFTHRAPGLIGAAADCGDATVELICDGVHIHPAVIRASFKLFGRERIILVSDTMRATGLPDGEYTLGGQPVFLNGRKPTLADGTIAGSATDLMSCMKTAVAFGIPLADAAYCAAVTPARALGIFENVGSLDAGKLANFIVLDDRLEIKAMFFKGKQIR